jgi:hypothetical protein
VPAQQRWVTLVSGFQQCLKSWDWEQINWINRLISWWHSQFLIRKSISNRIWLARPECQRTWLYTQVFYIAIHLTEPNQRASTPSKNLKAHSMFLSETSGSVNLLAVQLSLVSRRRMEGASVFGHCRQNQLCLALHCTIHVQEAPPASGPV